MQATPVERYIICKSKSSQHAARMQITFASASMRAAMRMRYSPVTPVHQLACMANVLLHSLNMCLPFGS